ncbi:class I SAM-dependent methyltransferase [Streptomyces alkaliterrae]|uniref:Class I SAM-dependent methyltransferase n=1 Tax=Streptomyces alkaliterrae TaxID=2213162 RepID=A0A5P0YMR7_9ACTN|nr:class I SAM-dependent methyltransferase [Streptomyces alkaliterrae]MBB1253390.1 class I SAM-dependent methyltransferase [Streptomyces alkaliterrae]MBB1259184.1 class I SAM-dependent methyltransferase [Streptomyces alkaliterrae]MQS01586.1 methyltransferase domain-containing protein [Streptomyces alkaliterrae]
MNQHHPADHPHDRYGGTADGTDVSTDDADDADDTAVRRPAGEAESVAASRHWWDRNADEYQREHGDFLGDDRFVWGPEGLDEERAGLLGPASGLAGRRVLEIGAGAAQCSRWLAARGARPVAVDVSHRQLQHARRIGTEGVALLQADAGRLPLADASFDLACSAYGAVPFVADAERVFREVRRVLRPGGRWVFSLTHPIRWALPDEPGPEGLTVAASYFDRTPYVEQDESGRARYVEHHRTLGDRVRELTRSGFRLLDLVEPEWPEWNHQEWGGWSPLRGRLIPGTAIFVCVAD